MTTHGPDRPRRRLRSVLAALGLVTAGVAFAVALAALTTQIATPEIGLRGIPTVGEVAPAPPVADGAGGSGSRSTTVPTTSTEVRTAPTTSTPSTTPTVEDPPETEDGPETQDDDSGRGRGRGRGRSDDDDDD
jgi:hypothetical protein